MGGGRGGEGTPYWTHSVLDYLISSFGGDWFVGYVKCTSSFFLKYMEGGVLIGLGSYE